MCSKMDTENNLAAFAASDWLDALIKEYEDEVKVEARWPTLLLQSSGRKMVWSLSALLGVNNKGVPGSACRLLERYLSRHIRSFLQQPRSNEEWDRYKQLLSSRFCLLMLSCVLLAAKMSDLLAPLSASMVRYALLKEGIEYTTAEIVDMEFHVYQTLDFRIPLWTTLEIAEFLARQIGVTGSTMMVALGMVINLTEYHRDELEIHMKFWLLSNTPGSSSSASASYMNANRVSLHNLHVCAGAVSAAARYMHYPLASPADRLATLTRSSAAYISAISDSILQIIMPPRAHILKKRRLV